MSSNRYVRGFVVKMIRKIQAAVRIKMTNRITAQATGAGGDRFAMTIWNKLRATIGRMKKLKSNRTILPMVKGMFFCRRSSSLVFVAAR